MNEIWRQPLGNPSSQHSAGQHAARVWRRLKDSVLVALGGRLDRFPADQLLITSSGTESNHLALWGLVDWKKESSGATKVNLVVSAIEHPSVLRSAQALAQAFPLELRIIRPDSAGRLSASAIEEAIDSQTRLVSIIAANNETGVIQPIDEIAAVCRQRGVVCHSDATQAVGKTGLNFAELGLTALTIAAHKFHGPLGTGALIVEGGRTLHPVWHGGFQQQGMRPGTESVALLAGMEAALSWYFKNQESIYAKLLANRNSFEARLLELLPDCVPLGDLSHRLPNTSLMALRGVDRQAFVMAADVAGVACSTGSACASGSSEPSTTLLAMGTPKELVQSAIRFSFGALQTPETGLQAAEIVARVAKALRR